MKKIIFLVILFTAGYFYLFCVHRVYDGSFGIVRDNDSGGYLKIIDQGWNIIIEGITPGRISVNSINKKNTDNFNLKIPLVPLPEPNEFYSIKMPVNVIYTIDINRFSIDLIELSKGRKAIIKILEMLIGEYIKTY